MKQKTAFLFSIKQDKKQLLLPPKECGANGYTLETVSVTEAQRKNQNQYTGLCNPISVLYQLDHIE